MRKYFITCVLPDGVNYFCGLHKHPLGAKIELVEWDTDITFARGFDTEQQAREMWDLIKIQKDETWKIEPLFITPSINPKLN